MTRAPTTIAVMAAMLAGVKDGSIRGQIYVPGLGWSELTKEQWADFELRDKNGREFRVTSPTYGDVAIRLFVDDLKKNLPAEGGVN